MNNCCSITPDPFITLPLYGRGKRILKIGLSPLYYSMGEVQGVRVFENES
jgi:hypothetical protein